MTTLPIDVSRCAIPSSCVGERAVRMGSDAMYMCMQVREEAHQHCSAPVALLQSARRRHSHLRPVQVISAVQMTPFNGVIFMSDE